METPVIIEPLLVGVPLGLCLNQSNLFCDRHILVAGHGVLLTAEMRDGQPVLQEHLRQLGCLSGCWIFGGPSPKLAISDQ